MDWDDRIGRRLTLRDLSILLAAVEAGSVSKAATRLRVSQPAISKTIAQLERAVGARLLIRSSRGIEPTEHGHAMIARIRAAIRELHAGVDSMNDVPEALSGELRIAANQVALSGILPTIIDRLCNRHEGIVYHVVPSPTFADQARVLEDGSADLAIGRINPPDVADRLRVVELFPEKFVVVAGPRNRWTRRKKIGLAELVKEPWAFPALDTMTGQYMVEIFRANGLEIPKPNVAAYSLQLHQWLVVESNFLALFPDSLAKTAEGMRVLPVPLMQEPRSIGIMTLKYRTPGALAQLFIDEAQAAAREFHWGAPE
jgi:DNA-binding transcriptional LysR family regulator